MYNGITAAQESGLSMTLTGLKLEKYLQLFNKKGIKFDTFVNMTKEDLTNIGITDDADQEAILDGVEPLKHLYRDVSDLGEPNTDAILGNNIHHMKALLGMMILIRRKLQKKKPKNTLIDITHSAGGAIINLLDTLDAQLEYVKSDLLGTEVLPERKSSRKKLWGMLGFLTAALTLTSVLTIRHFGVPTILNKYNVLLFLQKT